MAAASPIVLNSSSPNSYQLPPVTPPSVQEKSRILISSSPQLPSPSHFLKTSRPSVLKSGSRVQQAPEGARIGFASAGSLWKADALEQQKRIEDARLAEDVSVKKKAESKASSGKLVKPKKPTKKRDDGEPAQKKQKLDEYSYLDQDEPKAKKQKKKTVLKTTTAETQGESASIRKSPTSLAKYALDTAADGVENKGQVKAPLSKPRKSTKKTAREASPAALETAKTLVVKPEQVLDQEATAEIDDYSLETHQTTERFENFDVVGAQIPKVSSRDAMNAPETVDATLEPLADCVLIEAKDLQSPKKAHPINIANYALDSPIEPETLKTSMTNTNHKPKKPRKKVVSQAIGDHIATEAPAKKPRKRKKKSESVILNSDEPELFNGPSITSNYFQEAQHETITTSKGQGLTERTAVDADPVDIVSFQFHDVVQGEHPKRVEPENADVTEPVAQKSKYFSNATNKDFQTKETATLDSPEGDELSAKEIRALASLGVLQAASSTHCDQSPVKGNIQAECDHERPPTSDSEASAGPKRQLNDIIGGFGYVCHDTELSVTERSATGEALTKRRRLELGPAVGVGAAPRIEKDGTEKSPPKLGKQKKGRKKGQTITALATAAFQPPEEHTTDDGSISHFFSPTKPNVSNEAASERPKAKPAKARKPRRPKPKDDSDAQSAKPKKTSKPKKAKVKFNEADYRLKLYSPGRATAQLKGQDFLFGTSSQLAMGEPGSFIRDMQVAIQQSEIPNTTHADEAPRSSQVAISQVQQNTQAKSCIRVPTAPHGTCLSMEQARRELWCVSTRDSTGGVLRPVEVSTNEECDIGEDTARETARLPDALAGLNAEADVEKPADCNTKAVVVDLSDTSPIAAATHVGAVCNEYQDGPTLKEGTSGTSIPVPDQDTEDADDWMLIQSSSPLPIVPPSITIQQPVACQASLKPSDGKLLSPRRFRPPLSPLNPNTLMLSQWSPEQAIQSGQIRSISSTATGQARNSRSKSPGKRRPGRPRKESASENDSLSSPKRRGRPPKSKALASEPSQLPKPKKLKAAMSASQPAEQSEFIDIDDIYDSDSPATPSPPRRRATSSPPAVQPLALSPSIKAKAPSIATAVLKSKNTDWESIRSELFTRITTVVKTAPRSNDASKPSWYEKVLLYDPIVLEDLTAWLNEQGLRVEVKKCKPKAKKRGRKIKDAEPVEDELEWEVEEEPLQAWQVQRWCEKNSICCLWKEGLRGGVRTRY